MAAGACALTIGYAAPSAGAAPLTRPVGALTHVRPQPAEAPPAPGALLEELASVATRGHADNLLVDGAEHRRALALPIGLRLSILVDGAESAARVHVPDATGALAEIGIRLGAEDRLEVSSAASAPIPADELEDGARLAVIRVTHEQRRAELSIPFATREIPDGALPLDERRVEREGFPGLRVQVHDIRLEDGREAGRTLVSDEVARAPEERVVRVGTRAPALPADPSFTAVRTINGSATSYCLTGTTATGTQAGPGAIAVDPSVIRLGSHLYVTGYGFGTAVDTGSAIIGTLVDLWYGCDQAIRWGRRPVTIYVLDH